MTPSEAAKVLAVAAVYDRRTIGRVEAIAWADALDDLDPTECAEAVRAHYRDSTAWLMPGHVRDRVKAKRRADATARHDARVFAEIESAKARAVPRPRLEGASS